MTDNTQDINISLTPEQLQSIEQTKIILMNLENEISIANKNLHSLKLESERAIKDKNYQAELLTEVISKVSGARSSLAEIEPQVVEKTAQLNNLIEHMNEANDTHQKKQIELDTRETMISKREKEVEEKSKKIDESNQTLKSHIETHNEKVAKLKQVITLF